jgi:hypothetical protein
MQDWTIDAVERVTESILGVLGDPLESHQAEALTAFKAGDYATVRRVAAVGASQLCNECKCLVQIKGKSLSL